MAEQSAPKEKELIIAGREERKTGKGNTFYILETEEGGKFTVWDKDLADIIPANELIKLRWTESKSPDGKFTNRSVVAVSRKNGESWGEWVEQKKKSYSPRSFDSEGANRRTAIDAASKLASAIMMKSKDWTSPESACLITVKMAKDLMAFLSPSSPAVAESHTSKTAEKPIHDEAGEEPPF